MRQLATIPIACLVAATCLGAAGAAPGAPVSDALRADLERYGKNIVAAAEAMPEDRYQTKPTDKQMSFADLIRHVTRSNTALCAAIAGEAARPPADLPAAPGKDALVRGLKESFSYCGSALARVDDSKLAEGVPFFGGRTVTRAAAMLDLAADWGDHYSLMATELRLAGQTPPTAQRRPGTGR